MTRKPTGAAALLAGLAEEQARGLLEDVAMINELPRPETYITLAQRVRVRAAIARSAVGLHKLQDQEDRRTGASEQDEADMDDRPDDADTIERKYVELQKLVDSLSEGDDAGRGQSDRSSGRTGYCPGQLVSSGEQRAA